MSSFDKPNVLLNLAASYNERGVNGFTATVTNSLDQRKINSIYEPINNPITGKTTLYLVKRRGVVINASSYGTTGQVGWLLMQAPGSTDDTNYWVFSVSGNDVRASSSSTTTVIVTAAGHIPSYVDRVAISGADTLVVEIRNNSTFAKRAFFSTAIATFTEITDATFTALTHVGKMQYMDGYAFTYDKPTNRIYNSDLNSLANWGDASYITKQIRQDFPRGLARLGKQILAFGSESVEIFQNAGTPTGSPLVTVPSLATDVGLRRQDIANYGHYSAESGGRLYFWGQRGGAYGAGIFAFDGQRFEKVSTPAIDKIVALGNGIFSTHVFSFDGKEGVAFAFDSANETSQRWLMYFPAWKDWFEWTSDVFSPVNVGIYHLGLGANQHRIYGFSNSETWQDDGTDYTWTHQFQLPSDGNQRKFMPYMGLKGDTARSAQNITVEKSDDDYQTFQTLGTIDMTGKQKRLVRCGQYEGARVIRLSHSGNTEVRLSQFLARIT